MLDTNYAATVDQLFFYTDVPLTWGSSHVDNIAFTGAYLSHSENKQIITFPFSKPQNLIVQSFRNDILSYISLDSMILWLRNEPYAKLCE